MSTDETQPVAPASSGSRWEQADAHTTPAPQPLTAPPAYAPAPQSRTRGRLLLAGGAVGIALVAGSGGFALGNATADDGRDGRDGPGLFGRFPDGGPQRTFPGQGQPGMPPPGFQDRRDDDQQLPGDPGT